VTPEERDTQRPGQHTNVYGRTAVDERHLAAYVNRGILALIRQVMPANDPSDPRDTEVPDA
jgi:hypothetical protein